MQLQAALAHDLVDVVVELVLGHNAVLTNRFAHDFADGQAGRQAGIGILEDDLHLRAQGAQLVAAELMHLAAVEEHLAAALVGQAQDGAADGGLAAAGFADQAHRGAALDVEADAVHRADIAHGALQQTFLDGEVFLELIDLEHVFRIVDKRRKRVVNGDLGHVYLPSLPFSA